MSLGAKLPRVWGTREERKRHARKRRRMVDKAIREVVADHLPLLKRLAAGGG